MQGFQSFLAPAKVNLFLHIVGRRDDGYHLLQSVFRLIALYDTVHIKIRHDGLITRARDIPGVPADQDLCIRAARLLQQHSACKLGADIAVDKRIPMGGGLGGGSSDAATVLLALNTLWDLKLDRQTLMTLGLKLGADVPFFIFGTSAWVEGIGEQIQPVALNPCHYIVLTPQVHVPTAEIFSAEELTRNTIPTTIAAFSRVLSGLPAETGTGVEQKYLLHEHDLLNERLQFHNDLEAVVCKRYPAVLSCMTWLNEQSTRFNEQNQPGVGVARMSGSGASVFVEVADEELASKLAAKVPRQLDGVPVFAYIARGLDQHPLSAVNLV